MFAKFIGYVSIAFGILWVVKPEFLRGWFLRKTNWYLFCFLLGLFFYPLIHFFGKKMGFLGILTVFVIFWVAMKITDMTLRKVFQKVPLVAFQIVGVLNMISGTVLILKSGT